MELVFIDTASVSSALKACSLSTDFFEGFTLDAQLPLQVTKVYMVQEQDWKSLSGFQASPFIGE